MYFENLVFIFFSFASLSFSFFVIYNNNPIYSILSLILVFFNTAGLLIFLNAEFLALLFIIVYVGAVAVLFLFVVMMLNIKSYKLELSVYRFLPISIIFGLLSIFELFAIFFKDLISLNYNFEFLVKTKSLPLNFLVSWDTFSLPVNNINIFGCVLYTHFSYLFIVSGIILLVAMLGSISLTLHKRNDIKRQRVHKQISRNFNNTIRWRN
jgi:NADH-quinone oxidoreductase subunit J